MVGLTSLVNTLGKNKKNKKKDVEGYYWEVGAASNGTDTMHTYSTNDSSFLGRKIK